MKAKFLLLAIAAVLFFTAASVWEGAATGISSGGDLPGGGFCAATNSFPQNSIVDITNLENGKTVRVIVVSGLENSGLLATLSRSAADAVGIRGNSVSRIRMSQPSDAVAFSRFREQNGLVPPAPTATVEVKPAETQLENAIIEPAITAEAVSREITPEEISIDEITLTEVILAETAVAETALTEVALTAEPSFSEPEQAVSTGAVLSRLPEDEGAEGTSMEITLVPSEEKIPTAEQHVIPNEYFIAPLDSIPQERSTVIPETHSNILPETSAVAQSFSPFRVPLIRSLEQGKWYVQIGVYNRPAHIENQINRIGTVYPIAVQNIGTDSAPVFRLLLGPLNQGESGAVLQRFKSIGYTDAFVRKN